MSDSNEMSEEQYRFMMLEAKVLQMQCQIVAVRAMILKYFEKSQVHFDQMSAADYCMKRQQEELDNLLRGLADFDPARATKISEMLKPKKNV